MSLEGEVSDYFRCDRCDGLQHVRCGPIAHYTLPDGRSFFATHGFGWCLGCRGLSEVEKHIDPTELNQWIESVTQDPELARFRTLVPAWELEIEWARLRRSPPRCLRCGSRDFRAVTEVDDRLWVEETSGRRVFQHPGCGGEFRAQPSIELSQPVPRALSENGELLEGAWDETRERSRDDHGPIT